MKAIMTRGIMGVIVLGASIAAAQEPVSVGLQKQLFVDDYVVAKKENVTLEAGRAKKYGVVMAPTLVTDFQSGKVHDGPDSRAVSLWRLPFPYLPTPGRKEFNSYTFHCPPFDCFDKLTASKLRIQGQSAPSLPIGKLWWYHRPVGDKDRKLEN